MDAYLREPKHETKHETIRRSAADRGAPDCLLAEGARSVGSEARACDKPDCHATHAVRRAERVGADGESFREHDCAYTALARATSDKREPFDRSAD